MACVLTRRSAAKRKSQETSRRTMVLMDGVKWSAIFEDRNDTVGDWLGSGDVTMPVVRLESNWSSAVVVTE